MSNTCTPDTTTPDAPTPEADALALGRGYKRILALSPYMQTFIDPKLLEASKKWLPEAETECILEHNHHPRSLT